jgi:hypothetical protein
LQKSRNSVTEKPVGLAHADTKETMVTTSQQYRAKAAEAAQLARQSKSLGDIRQFVQAERSFTTLADNEDWLAANADKLVSPDPFRDDRLPPS